MKVDKKSLYFDTSFYLAILLGEGDLKRFHRQLAKASYCTSSFMFLEAERNLIRLSREKKMKVDFFHMAIARLKEDRELFLVKEATLDVCTMSAFPAISTPRSADLLHLRTALWFKEQGLLSAFCSFDLHQMQGARELGLPVLY